MLILLATGLTLIAIRNHRPEKAEPESIKITKEIAKFEKEIFETQQILLRYENDATSEELNKMLKSNIIILQKKFKELPDE